MIAQNAQTVRSQASKNLADMWSELGGIALGVSAIAAGVLLKSLTVDQQVRIEELVVSEKDPVIQSIIHVPKNQTFQKAMTGRFDKANVRFWIKADSSSKVGKKRGREETARELISDIFDGYTLVNDVSKLLSPVSELLGTRESLKIIVEIRNTVNDAWPRDDKNILQQSENTLQVGDMIDALDSQKSWCSAKVIRVDPDVIRVHFQGWGKQFDENISREAMVTRTAPLYSKTENPETWTTGSKVEIKINPENKTVVWFVVRIIAVDFELHSNRVQVCYSAREKQQALDLHYRGSVSDGSDPVSSPTGDRITPSDDLVKEWFDVKGEEICSLGTHTTLATHTHSKRRRKA